MIDDILLEKKTRKNIHNLLITIPLESKAWCVVTEWELREGLLCSGLMVKVG
jgi:hypothetical protein